MKIRKTLYAVAAFTILMTTSEMTYASEDLNKSIKENESKVEVLKEEKNKLSSEISVKKEAIEQLILDIDILVDEQKNLEKEIKKNEEEIRVAEEKIQEVKAEIEKLQKDIDERVKIVGSRMLAYQVNGDVGYLDVFLGSDSFSDLMSRVYMVAQIVEADNKIIEDLDKDMKLVEVKLAEVETLKENLKLVKEDNESKKTALIKNIESVKKNKLQLETEMKELNTSAEEIQSQQDALIEKINADVKEREAQEEAARVKAQSELASKSRMNALAGLSQEVSVGTGSGQFAWPTSGGYISSGQGSRTHPKTGEVGTFHKGIDIARNDKSTVPPIFAAESGVIVAAQPFGGLGNMIRIKHDNGLETVYGHLSMIDVKVGQTVTRGQKIGTMGTTGMSTGIHLHFEVYQNGALQNPLKYIN